MPNTNEEAFTKMTKEEQEQFAATLFSILALQMNIWADILKKSQKVPPPIKNTITKFQNVAGVVRNDVIRPMFSKQLVNIENIVELANLILAQHTSDAGRKKLELILAILADEKVEVINEATHFAMPKKQKKQ